MSSTDGVTPPVSSAQRSARGWSSRASSLHSERTSTAWAPAGHAGLACGGQQVSFFLSQCEEKVLQVSPLTTLSGAAPEKTRVTGRSASQWSLRQDAQREVWVEEGDALLGSRAMSSTAAVAEMEQLEAFPPPTSHWRSMKNPSSRLEVRAGYLTSGEAQPAGELLQIHLVCRRE